MNTLTEHEEMTWRFATTPSSGEVPFRLISGESLIAEISPCPTFGSGWTDDKILSLIAAAPSLLSENKRLREALQIAESIIAKIECGEEKSLVNGYVLDQVRAALDQSAK